MKTQDIVCPYSTLQPFYITSTHHNLHHHNSWIQEVYREQISVACSDGIGWSPVMRKQTGNIGNTHGLHSLGAVTVKNETPRGNDCQLYTPSARPGACPGSRPPAGVRAMGRSRHQHGGVSGRRTSSSYHLGATWRPPFSASRRHRQNVTRRATGA